jgi:hypothetical protein
MQSFLFVLLKGEDGRVFSAKIDKTTGDAWQDAVDLCREQMKAGERIIQIYKIEADGADPLM